MALLQPHILGLWELSRIPLAQVAAYVSKPCVVLLAEATWSKAHKRCHESVGTYCCEQVVTNESLVAIEGVAWLKMCNKYKTSRGGKGGKLGFHNKTPFSALHTFRMSGTPKTPTCHPSMHPRRTFCVYFISLAQATGVASWDGKGEKPQIPPNKIGPKILHSVGQNMGDSTLREKTPKTAKGLQLLRSTQRNILCIGANHFYNPCETFAMLLCNGGVPFASFGVTHATLLILQWLARSPCAIFSMFALERLHKRIAKIAQSFPCFQRKTWDWLQESTSKKLSRLPIASITMKTKTNQGLPSIAQR